MKKLLLAVALTLALNFLAVVGGTAYLWKSGHLDKERIKAIKLVLFPPAAAVAIETGDTTRPSTQPSLQMDELLKKAAGRTAEEQVEFLQRSFDSRMAQLDLRSRQLDDQQHTLDFSTAKLAEDRAALEAEKKRLASAEQQAAILAGDQGFQDSLAVYLGMPPAKVKVLFEKLPDEVVEHYLEAMPAQKAGKIINEFKSPDEISRMQKVLELMRKPPVEGAATQPAAAASAAPAAP
jgi:flagellar motility protein MotE (MotC chaperone)